MFKEIKNNEDYLLEQVFQLVMNFKESKQELSGLTQKFGITSNWFTHKTKTKKKGGKHYNKIEVYGYFKLEDLDDMISHLNNKKIFKYASSSNGKYPMYFDMAQKMVSKITNGNLEEYKNNSYGYNQDFIKVLIHRNCYYLIRIYHLVKKGSKDYNNSYFKLEITYQEVENKNMRKRVTLNTNKPHSIIEIIKKIELNGKGFIPIINENDFSNGINFNDFYDSLV